MDFMQYRKQNQQKLNSYSAGVAFIMLIILWFLDGVKITASFLGSSVSYGFPFAQIANDSTDSSMSFLTVVFILVNIIGAVAVVWSELMPKVAPAMVQKLQPKVAAIITAAAAGFDLVMVLLVMARKADAASKASAYSSVSAGVHYTFIGWAFFIFVAVVVYVAVTNFMAANKNANAAGTQQTGFQQNNDQNNGQNNPPYGGQQ